VTQRSVLGSRLMAGFPPPAEKQVTLANWQDPPYNRWAFRNVRNLIPTANVWRGGGTASPLPAAARDLDRIPYEDCTGRTTSVGDMLEEGFTDGFMVIHEGTVLAERYLNGLTPDQPHLLMSVSKSVTSALAGILVQRGLLEVGRAVSDILPELAGTGYEGASVRHLLDMTVGTDYSEDYEDPASDVRGLDFAAGWRPREERADADDNIRDHARTVRPGAAHGEVFHYVSINTDVLGWVLERVSRQPLASLLSEFVWQPMGAEFDAYITVDRYGAPMADGGLCASLRDLARFGLMHLHGGALGGRQIVPAEWIADIRENGDREAWAKGDFADSLDGVCYRSKWYLMNEDHGAYCGIGVHGQTVYVDPAASMVIAKFSSQPRPVDDKLFNDMFRAFHAIGRELAGT